MKRHLFVPIGLILIVSAIVYSGLLFEKKPQIGGGFQLTDSLNKPWDSKNSHGKLSVLYFGFTRCPDVCPITLHKIKNSLNQWNKKFSQKVQVIFVSVDHKSDTPKVANDYAKNVHSSFLGLSGTKKQIDKVVRTFKTTYLFEKMKDSAMDYTVLHSNRVYINDQKGQFIDSLILEDGMENDFINIIKRNL